MTDFHVPVRNKFENLHPFAKSRQESTRIKIIRTDIHVGI